MDNIELRDEIYNDVHKLTPSWWTVWGTYIVFSFIMIFLVLSYFIKYPDIILAEAKFVSNIPSVTMPSKIDTKIESIVKPDGTYVNKGDYILVFLDNSNYNDIIKVKNKLSKFKTNSDKMIFFEDGRSNVYNLGIHIQESWNNLMELLLEYAQIIKYKKYDLEIDRLSKELFLYQKIANKSEKMISYNSNIKGIADNRNKTDSMLISERVISKYDYADGVKKYLEIKKGFIGEELSYERENLEIRKIINAIDQLKQLKDEKLIELDVNIKKAFLNLELSLNSWEDTYVIKTPVSGYINFLSPLKENLHVSQGEDLIIITPDSIKFDAQIKIPFAGAGKIKTGQMVHIKLNDYPYNEYGRVTGHIEKISNVANKDYYLGKVALDNYKITDYKKKITIKENTMGIAEIITEDRSWLGRLFEKVIYVFTR